MWMYCIYRWKVACDNDELFIEQYFNTNSSWSSFACFYFCFGFIHPSLPLSLLISLPPSLSLLFSFSLSQQYLYAWYTLQGMWYLFLFKNELCERHNQTQFNCFEKVKHSQKQLKSVSEKHQTRHRQNTEGEKEKRKPVARRKKRVNQKQISIVSTDWKARTKWKFDEITMSKTKQKQLSVYGSNFI